MFKNKSKLVGLVLLVCLSTGSAQSVAARDRLAEKNVLGVVKTYIALFGAYDYEGMGALSTPNAEISDYGIRLDHAGFTDHVHHTAGIYELPLEPSAAQFNTVISGDVAYTSFMFFYGGGEESLGTMILRRVKNKWLVDRFIVTPANNEVLGITHQFYYNLKKRNFDDIQRLVRKDFTVTTTDGKTLDYAAFEKWQKSQKLGDYSLSDFQSMNPVWIDFDEDEKITFTFVETTTPPNSKTETSRRVQFTLKHSLKPSFMDMGEPKWRVFNINFGWK